MEKLNDYKIMICSIAGAIGSYIANLYGGWNEAMTALFIAMCTDYVFGVLCAAIWHKSPKSKNGKLESRAGLKGLIRKGMMLAVVLIAAQADVAFAGTWLAETLGEHAIRTGMCIGLFTNELISIGETAKCIGAPLPSFFYSMIDMASVVSEKASDALKPKEQKEND